MQEEAEGVTERPARSARVNRTCTFFYFFAWRGKHTMVIIMRNRQLLQPPRDVRASTRAHGPKFLSSRSVASICEPVRAYTDTCSTRAAASLLHGKRWDRSHAPRW